MKVKIILLPDIRQTEELTAQSLFLTIIKAVCAILPLEEARKVIENSITFFPSDETSEQQLREEAAADLKQLGVSDNRLSVWWKHVGVERTNGREEKQEEFVREIRLFKLIELAFCVYKDEKLSPIVNKHEFELDFCRVLNRVRENEI